MADEITQTQPQPIMQGAPNIIKADPSEPLPNLDDQLEQTLRAAFNKTSDEPKKPIENPDGKHEPEAKKEIVQKTEDPKTKAEPQKQAKETRSDLNSLQEPSGMSAKSREGWGKLKSLAQEYEKKANQSTQELETIKKTFAQKEEGFTKQVKELQEQIQQLSGFRAAVDIQADPEFIQKFEAPMQKLHNEIVSLFKSKGVSDEVVGMMDLSDSDAMSRVLAAVEEGSDKLFSKKLSRKIEDYIDLSDKKNEEIGNWKTNHSKFIEERKNQLKGKQAEEEGRILKAADEIIQKKNEDGSPYIPFLSRKEVSPGMNKDQQKAIEAHNSYVDQMSAKLKSVLSSTHPEDRVEVAIAALSAEWLNGRLQETVAENKRLQEELNKISGISNDGESRAPSSDSPRKGMNYTASDPSSLDLDASMKHHLGRS